MTEDEIDKIYALDDVITSAGQVDALYIERYDMWQMDRSTLHAFAKRVAAKEREACIAVCERHAKIYSDLPKTLVTDLSWAACIDIRDSIKRRGDV